MDIYHQKHCLECGKELHGRIDKRFCDSYCRNTYNNRNKSKEEKYIHHVNSIIRANRRILRRLCPIGKATVPKQVLDSMGYDYNYFSSIHHPAKLIYYVCYDYAFAPIKDEHGEKKALIVQRQSYQENKTELNW